MIKVSNIRKKYKDNPILEDVSFEFKENMSYAITGANGCGKSVLLKLLCGFSLPDQGAIYIKGIKLGEKYDFIQNAGVSINAPEFVKSMTGYENLKALAEIRNVCTDEDIYYLCERLGIDNVLNKKYKTYSLGMKQKLRLVQALMEDPDILILDEPFNALDEDSVKTVKNLLNDFIKLPHKLLIFTSHHYEDVCDLANQILIIKNKKLYFAEDKFMAI